MESDMSNEYNGWTNRETWLVNIWFMDGIDGSEPVSAEYLQEYVEDYVELMLGQADESGFIADMLDMSGINWIELADNHNSELEETE
jgi:hypothetical protein